FRAFLKPEADFNSIKSPVELKSVVFNTILECYIPVKISLCELKKYSKMKHHFKNRSKFGPYHDNHLS
ncbi:MAG: hypothetical protein ABF511_10950, partial [Lentilactobacillus hilgardii]